MTQAPKKTAAFYLALVFLAGTALGFAANQFYSTQSAEADRTVTATELREKWAAELDAQLELNSEQVNEILVIFEDVGERFHSVRDAMDPEFEAIRSERASRIMALLTPAQQADYQQIVEERRRRRDERRRLHREQQH